MLQVFSPQMTDTEISAATEVLQSGWLGRGQLTQKFEDKLAEHLRVRRNQLLTTNSCTEAAFQVLHLIRRVGGEVVLPGNSFVGVANAVLDAGMKPIFCELDPQTGNVDADDLLSRVTSNTVAVIVQHWGGFPADVLRIKDSLPPEVILIEDVAGSIATTLEGRAVGTVGDFGLWSFDAMKILVCGDGGLIYANDESAVADLRLSTYMGLKIESGQASADTKDRWWEFEVSLPGRRSIMNDLGSALGIAQLSRLHEMIESRRKNSFQYLEMLSDIEGLFLWDFSESTQQSLSHYFFPIRVDRRLRDGLARELFLHEIYSTYRYFPLNRLPLYGPATDLPLTEKFSSEVLLLPQHPNLTQTEVAKISEVVANFISKSR